MSDDTPSEIVEHSGREPGHTAKSHNNERLTNPLPWESPDRFSNVPSHAGPLRSDKQAGWSADSDAEAAAVWLAERASASPNTAQAYRKEVERFLFWLSDQGMAISDAMREDYLRYGRFLLNPQPKAKWCSEKRHGRNSPNWRPFQKALTPNTARHSLTIVRSLIRYLHERGWLIANPMPEVKHLVATRSVHRADEIMSRQIPPDIMGDINRFLDTYASEHPSGALAQKEVAEGKRKAFLRARAKVIVALSAVLAARSSDLIGGHLNDFMLAPAGMSVDWVWHIPAGKGAKAATLPVPSDVMSKISNMRVLMGLPAYPSLDEPPYPIVPDSRVITESSRTNPDSISSLSRSGLHLTTKALLQRFAVSLDTEGRHAEAESIRRASGHWFRHTAIKSILTKTGNLTTAQKLARHNNINTTAEYAKSTLGELADALSLNADSPEKH